MTADKLISYFKDRELPATIKVSDGTITDCKAFVAAQLIRLESSSAAIRNASVWLLEDLHDCLEKK